MAVALISIVYMLMLSFRKAHRLAALQIILLNLTVAYYWATSCASPNRSEAHVGKGALGRRTVERDVLFPVSLGRCLMQRSSVSFRRGCGQSRVLRGIGPCEADRLVNVAEHSEFAAGFTTGIVYRCL